MSSKVVDQRVVQMEFDNRRFEKNVSTTMSSLDKLKQKLNFTGAVKGFDNINTATKNVNMNGLASAVDTVHNRFSALEIMGVTALANITNSAVNAGKRILSALTIQPVTTGFSEYETQINAIQTILANTKSKGTTLDDVNQALDTLNEYADKTIYNFTEMTRNIGTFTAAGVKLDTSVKAIQGIANLAAVSGSTSQQASTAMYQLSQALASGTVKLMDWNSVVNAGMGGEVFQNALKETARVHGVAIDEMIEKNGSFRETLKEEWLTADILTETLEQFTMNTKYATEAEVKANREKLKSIGYTEKQIDAIFELGDTATGAATEVKTFSQLWDTLKESAQSGWTQTWEIIVGDFEEAKSFLTILSKGIGGAIEAMSSWRNGILESALGSKWTQLTSKINAAGISTEVFNEKFGKVAKEHGISLEDLIEKHGSLENAISKGAISTDLISKTLRSVAEEAKGSAESTEDLSGKLEYFQDVVTKVWRGDYGNMEDRYKALTAAGYDYAQVQALVNKTVDGHKLTLEDLTDSQMKSLGYTEEQIKAIHNLADEAEKTGTPLNELIASLEKPSGRTLLIESLTNAAQGLKTSFIAVKEAFMDIFPEMKSENISATLYKIIEAVNAFSEKLKMGDETAEKLKRTFKGVFAAIDIVLTLIAGPLKMMFKAVLDMLGLVDVDILSVTANVGDAIVKLRDWIDEHNIFTVILKKLLPFLKDAAEGIKNWINNLKDSDNIGKDIVDGLVNGLWAGIKRIGSIMLELAKKIVDTVKNYLGIHSPSTVFFAIGAFIIAGLLLGLKSGIPGIGDVLTDIGQKIADIFSEFDLEKIIAVAFGAGLFTLLFKIVSVLVNFSKMVLNISENLGDMFEGLGFMFKSAGKMLKGIRNWFNAMALLNVILAIGILAKAVVSIAESEASIGELWNAVGIIAVLTVFAVGLAILMGKLDLVGGMGFKTILSVAAVAGAILLLSMSIGKLASMNLENVQPALTLLTGILGLIAGVIAIMAWISKGSGEKEAFKVGRTLIALSVAMLIMVGVVKLASMLAEDADSAMYGLGVIALIAGVFAGLFIAFRIAGEHANKAGVSIMAMSFSLLLMIGVIKIASGVAPEELNRASLTILAIMAVFAGMVTISKFAGENGAKAGGSILMMSLAMVAMVSVIKLISCISDEEVARGLGTITKITLLFAGIILISRLAGENAMKAGVLLLAMSGAVLIIVGILFLLTQFEPSELARAMTVVTAISLIFMGLIAVTKNIPANALGSLITLVVAVGLISGIVIGLSFMNRSKLKNAVAAMTVLMLTFAILIGVTKFAGDTKSVMGTLIALGVIVVSLGLLLIAMRDLDPTAAIANALILSGFMLILMGLLVAINHITKLCKGSNVLTGVGLLTAMMVPLLAAVGILALMSGVENAMTSTQALIVLVGAMSILIVALNYIAKICNNGDVVQGMIWLTATLVALLPAVGILALMSGVNNSVTNTLALVILVGAMSALIVALNYIAKLCVEGSVVKGILLLTAMMVPLLVAVGILALMSGVENAISNATVLITLITVLSLLLVPLAFVGAVGLYALAGIGVLLAFMAALGGFIAAVGYFVSTECPKLEQFIDTGLPILEKLAYGLGSLLSHFSAGLFAGLPAIGESLSNFMDSIQRFFEGAKNIDPGAVDSIGSLVGAVMLLTTADFLNGIGKFLGLTGGDSLGTFGTQLVAFGDGLGTFFQSLTDAGLTEEKLTLVELAADALKSLAETSKSIPNSGGWLGTIVGDNDLGVFAEQFPKLGSGLSAFVYNIGTFGEEQLLLVKNAASAITTLATASSDIPNQGGWAGVICGENTMDLFAAQFPKLADGLRGFIDAIGSFGEPELNLVSAAAEAVKTLAGVAQEIPNAGGLLAGFVGDNRLGTFAKEFPKLADGLRGFLDRIGTIDDTAKDQVDYAASVVERLAAVANNIPNAGGILADLVGDNQLGTFATEFPKLGAGIRGFIIQVGELTSGELVSSARALQVVETVTDLVNIDVNSLSKKIKTLGSTLETFGDDLVAFSESMHADGMTVSLKNAVDGVRDLTDALNDIGSDKANNLKVISDSLKNLGQNGIKAFVDAFSGSDASAKVRTAAGDMVKNFVSAVKSYGSKVGDTFVLAASSAYHRLISTAVYSQFYSAGKYLAEGFAQGISANAYKAVNAASAMVSSVEAMIRAVALIKSPSKMTYTDGEFLVQGLVNALLDGTVDVDRAARDMAESATTGLRDAISKISDIIQFGIDAQPTIRPVLDLDDVRAGASQIGGMLNMSPSVGVLANVNSIASTMNKRGQNGVNDDVVSELGKLRKDISSIKHVSYNIEGINYGEGSEVAEAIETLVRAALIERRV